MAQLSGHPVSCCAAALPVEEVLRHGATAEIHLASRDIGQGRRQVEISVPSVHCAACIHTVETGLARLDGVERARVNLSNRRVSVQWQGETTPDLLAELDRLGHPGHLSEQTDEDAEYRRLIRAVAVAGFGAMNVMLLSVSVWSGADAETRQAFHWISAALTFPCLLYSGRIFFASAWAALRRGRTNMDVPISVGICLAFALSLYDTLHGGPDAYFDAAISLVFYLLIGRTLDYRMRIRARSAVRGLARLEPRGAMVLQGDGRPEYLPVGEIVPGMKIVLAAGDRVPVDGIVSSGASDVDCALATGESAPQPVGPGAELRAGMLNLSGPLEVSVSQKAADSFLARMVRLMEAAEGGRAAYRILADRVASLYAPVVHLAALATFFGWFMATGDWHHSITVAIAVLIITCPCALGLAVPIVQMTAARRLFENQIMVKDGAALERLSKIDTVVFDKTGTLTLGRPRLTIAPGASDEALAMAGLLADHSNHPYARAIAEQLPAAKAQLTAIKEHHGNGIEGRCGPDLYRLGRQEWAATGTGGTVLARNGAIIARFSFDDPLRPGAHACVNAMKASGLRLLILSGDERASLAAVAAELGITEFGSKLLPAEKIDRIAQLQQNGARVLMVGDGLNDAPALTTADVSMAPGSAADIGRNAAGFVFLSDRLDSVFLALTVAQRADGLIRQNIALAVIYNLCAVPVAIAGFVTPMVAALAMSSSSLLVVCNALRLGAKRKPQKHVRASSAPQPVFE